MKTEEEYEDKIGELELQVEEMERTNSLIYGLLLGALSYIQWHNWYYSISIGIATIAIYWKFLAKKPFTNNMEPASDDE